MNNSNGVATLAMHPRGLVQSAIQVRPNDVRITYVRDVLRWTKLIYFSLSFEFFRISCWHIDRYKAIQFLTQTPPIWTGNARKE